MHYGSLDMLLLQLGCEFYADKPMCAHTSFRIGGPADRLVKVDTEQQLKSLLEFLNRENIPCFILGNGSNLLVRDGGIRGVVISLSGDFKKIELLDSSTIFCGAGVQLSALCIFAREQGLTGLEFAYGIPGTAGGAAYMNAGAYGGEMKDVLLSCQHMGSKGETGEFTGHELELGYRHSVYSGKSHVITGLKLGLKAGDKSAISARMEELMNRRRDKQPLELPSAGSTFKRPEGYFAAALIEECGLKGFSVGGAQVSEKHSGFLVNKNQCSCKDMLKLIDSVKAKVMEEKGLMLECEVKLIGEET